LVYGGASILDHLSRLLETLKGNDSGFANPVLRAGAEISGSAAPMKTISKSIQKTARQQGTRKT
jgi:hypothetical protein